MVGDAVAAMTACPAPERLICAGTPVVGARTNAAPSRRSGVAIRARMHATHAIGAHPSACLGHAVWVLGHLVVTGSGPHHRR